MRYHLDSCRFIRSDNRIFDFIGFSRQDIDGFRIAECDIQFFGWRCFRNRNRAVVIQGEYNAVIGFFDILEDTSGLSRLALFSFIARCLAELCPRCTVVIGNVPVAVLDFQLRRYAVFSILSGLAILPVLAIFAGFAVLSIVAILSRLTIFSILTVAAFCFYLVAGIIRQPVAVKRPVIDSVGILLYSDNRGRAVFPVFAGFTVLTVFAILSVVNRNRCALGKGNGVTDYFSILGNGDDAGNAVLVLERIDKGLQG